MLKDVPPATILLHLSGALSVLSSASLRSRSASGLLRLEHLCLSPPASAFARKLNTSHNLLATPLARVALLHLFRCYGAYYQIYQ